MRVSIVNDMQDWDAVNQIQIALEAYNSAPLSSKALYVQRIAQTLPEDYFIGDVRVALLASHTIKPLIPHLETQGVKHRLRLKIHDGEFDFKKLFIILITCL